MTKTNAALEKEERMMKKFSCTVAILFAMCVPGFAQTGATGTWRVEGQGATFPWEVVLRVDGSGLTGMVNHCANAQVGIVEGHIEGNTITFKCKRGDGVTTIAFTGRLNGDEIAFTWKLELRDGSGPPPALSNLMFGPSAPPQFIAKRVPDGDLAELVDQVRGVEFAAAVNLPLKDVKVAGTFFMPQKVRRVRAVIVSLAWGLGQAFYEDPQVGRLLETTESAALIVRVSNIQTTTAANQQRGASPQSADALLMLLKKLAQESGHQELVDAPLLFWGHSAAAGFGGTFAAIHPERTIALVNYQGGGGTRVNMKVLSRIPSLYLAGGKDDATALANTLDMWKSGRSTGALWTFAIQPDATHGDNEFLKKANDLMIPWIAAVLRQRLSPDGKTLRAVTDASGWLGNNGTGTVAPSSAFIGSKAEASWLPDEATARGWQVVTGLGTAK